MSMPMTRGTSVLLAAGALLLCTFAAAPQAEASTIYACVKKNGTARFVSKKVQCKKGETKLSWSITGPAGPGGAPGKEGPAGKEGPVGKEGAAGQPQKAVSFNVTSEAPFVAKKITGLFTLSGVTVALDCANFLLGNVNNLEAFGPAGTRAMSGMTDSKATNEAATEAFQQLVYNVGVASTGTVFTGLVTNAKTPVANVGHVNATITTPGAIIFLDAFVEVGEDPKGCVVSGGAFSIPV